MMVFPDDEVQPGESYSMSEVIQDLRTLFDKDPHLKVISELSKKESIRQVEGGVKLKGVLKHTLN